MWCVQLWSSRAIFLHNIWLLAGSWVLERFTGSSNDHCILSNVRWMRDSSSHKTRFHFQKLSYFSKSLWKNFGLIETKPPKITLWTPKATSLFETQTSEVHERFFESNLEILCNIPIAIPAILEFPFFQGLYSAMYITIEQRNTSVWQMRSFPSIIGFTNSDCRLLSCTN